MSILELKNEIHQYIENADEQFIQLIYGMVKANTEEHIDLSDAHKKILEERLQSHIANPTSGSAFLLIKNRA